MVKDGFQEWGTGVETTASESASLNQSTAALDRAT